MAVGWMPLRGKGRPGLAAVPWVSAMVYGIVLAAGLSPPISPSGAP